jgi:S1-C subfamily serine protease
MSAKHTRRSVPADKRVKLKPHHAKPYRKRHVGLLVFSIAGLVVAGLLLVQYRDQIIAGFSSSRSFVSDIFTREKTADATIQSSYGFNISYDQEAFYASAISSETGDLYIGSELSTTRPYSVVRVAPTFSSGTGSETATSALTLTVHPGELGAQDTLGGVALQDGGIDAAQVMSIATESATLGGKTFEKTTWQSKQSNNLSPALTAKFVTYGASVNGNVITVVLSLGITGEDESVYAGVLQSLSFDNRVSVIAPATSAIIAKMQASRSILDIITNTTNTSAATNGVDLTGSEKVAALYSPAVVKVHNAYCMDISVDGEPYVTGSCSASSGSGFFVSQDGYLATNGHVAAVSAQDVVIQEALNAYVSTGNAKPLNSLLDLTALTAADFPAGASGKQTLAIMVDALYELDADRFTVTNSVVNLLVQVTAKNPDITALLQSTKNREEYTTSDKSVIKAKLIAYDFRVNDGYDGFRASDVAIIKVEGSNYPVVQLGEIDTAVQGADLSILGYPGNASDNGLVDSGSSKATLTTGKVSAVKNASGSDKKLIETDTTIGHGNSGGPALDDDGTVVGIATYTVDGSGEGNGVFNYIRDIKDFKDLADARNITFDTNSATQAAWQSGIANFYSSHYSKSLKDFATVKELYPNNSRVDEFIAAAEKRVAAGEDVVDFPLIPVLIASGVVLVGLAIGITLVVRHHKKHVIYNAGVAQGTVQPVGPGVKNQMVMVAPGSPTVQPQMMPPPVMPVVAPQAPVAPMEPTPPAPVEPQALSEPTEASEPPRF